MSADSTPTELGPYQEIFELRSLNSELEARVAERTRHLRESEQRFRSVVASVPGLIYRCTPDARQLQFAGGLVQDITGYPASDFMTGVRTFASLVHPDDVARVEHDVEEQLTGSDTFATEYRVIHASGEVHWVYERGHIVRDTDGAASWLDGVVVDVTDRKQAEDEVDRLKDEIIGIVSHELRAPLASVLGFAELLLRRDPPPEQRRKFLNVMLEEGRRLTSLVNDFLDLEQLRDSTHGIKLEPTDPQELLQGAVAAADSDPDHPIVLDVPPCLPRIVADERRIRQVLWNLISNARKYSPAPGEIRVTARCTGDSLTITVADQGIGIPREALPRLFDRFYRVDDPARINVTGAGLGLSIVKQLVEAHGGTVWADSDGPDMGACFGFTLGFAETPRCGMVTACPSRYRT
jgi:PAS domain S-box-containing protein